jgi:hypothetical protein
MKQLFPTFSIAAAHVVRLIPHERPLAAPAETSNMPHRSYRHIYFEPGACNVCAQRPALPRAVTPTKPRQAMPRWALILRRVSSKPHILRPQSHTAPAAPCSPAPPPAAAPATGRRRAWRHRRTSGRCPHRRARGPLVPTRASPECAASRCGPQKPCHPPARRRGLPGPSDGEGLVGGGPGGPGMSTGTGNRCGADVNHRCLLARSRQATNAVQRGEVRPSQGSYHRDGNS